MNLATQTKTEYENNDVSFDDTLDNLYGWPHLLCDFCSDTQTTTVEFCDKSVAVFDWNTKEIRTYNMLK